MAAVRCGVLVLAMVIIVRAAVSPQMSPPADGVTLRVIMVESEDEAYRVVEQLKRGEDFAVLAKKVSQDPSADNGGLVGRMALSGLRPELRKALDGVAVGQLSAVVQIPTGFAILKVVPDSEAAGAKPSAGRALAATGSVKNTIDFSGYGLAMAALREIQKPADWELDSQTICRIRTQSLAEAEQGFERELSPGSFLGSTSEYDLAQAHVAFGQLHAYFGRMSETIELFRKAQNLVARHLPAARLEVEELLGIAHLHKAELDNGFYSAPGDRCLLSVRPNHRLTKTADLKSAIDHFSQYLAERPELDVRWLLNVAYMLAGTYPNEVPRAQLIPPSAFASTKDVGRFVDVAPQSGLISVASAGGVIVDDFDNDGRLDVVTSSITGCEPMHFFRRGEDGRFVEQTLQAGLGNQLGGLNVLQTDYNNDGYPDILVLRGGWEIPQRKSLLRNNGDGTFTDVTAASGVARPVTSTQAAVWTDINQDGFLDLFIGNENAPAQLFLNKRDGTFEDIAHKAGVDRIAFTKGVAAADYDNDGWPDLYVNNMAGPNFLYHNNHDGTFTEVAQSAGVPGAGSGFATWFFDYDNDGWDDIFAATYVTSVEETARTYLRLPNNAPTSRLYRNRGDGTFEDVTRRVGLDKVFMPMGANFGDIDNDGFLDIYLGTGNPSYAALVPSVLLRNGDGKSFVDVTLSSGTGELHKGHGVAFADLDNDGDEDIVFEVGGTTPADMHPLRLFKNPGHGNDWLTLKLVGVKTNRAAIGARISVTVNKESGNRVIYRTVGNGSSFGASPLQQHIGLGRSARSIDIEIYWPTSNTRQRFTGVERNQFLEITEFAQDYRRLQRPFLRLGGSNHDASKR